MKTPRIFFLGAPKIEKDGKPIELNIAKAIALLAYLAVHREPVTRERVLGLLWADSASDAAHKNLRNALWTIRKSLGDDVLDTDENKLALGDQVWTDVREFETISDSQTSAAQSKIELYRAPLLDGLTVPDAPEFEIWLTTERERLAQLHLRALDALAKAYRANDNWRAVIETAHRALAHDNLQEPMTRALMEAHARLGERAEALRQYDLLRVTLERELGVAPLPETDDLRAAIVNGTVGTTRAVTLHAVAPRERAQPRATPFIGRASERAALTEELETAMSGHARVALLVGELGIGKSRLWREWSSQSALDATIFETRCLASTQSLPFAPLIELFHQPQLREQLFTRNSPVSSLWLAEIARLLPEICAVLPDLPAPATLPPDEERRRVFEALAQCLLALNTPRVLFIDDVHWADHATLDWLDYLIHRLRDHALLLVVAYRPEDAPSSLIRLVSSWARDGLTCRLPLARLTNEESAALVTALDGDPVLATSAQTQSAGNPYFLIELCRAAPDVIPPALNDLLRARLDALPETARQIVQAAAILEPDFDFATLRRTSGRGEEETLTALDALADANILVERGQRYDFAHPLVAAIVRDALGGARRAFLHRRAAEALEATHAGRLAQIAGRLAAHYLQADDSTRAAHFADLAAEHALALASPNEAANFYRQAIALEPTPARQMGLGNALLRQSDLDGARQAFQSALREFEAMADQRGAARACMDIAETYFPVARFDEGNEWIEKGLDYLHGVTDPEGRALAHLLIATSQLNASQLSEQAIAHARSAARHAAEDRLTAIEARARFTLGNLLAQRGDLTDAIESFLQSAKRAQDAGDDYQQTLGYNNAAYHSLLAGNLAAAREYVEKGLTLAETHALQLPLQYLYSTRGEIALAEQKWDEADQWFTRGLAETESHGNREQAANYRANLALAARGRGDLDDALARLEEAGKQAALLNASHLQTQIDLWLAELYLARGERAAANEALTRAQARLRGSERGKLIEWAEKIRAQMK